LRRPILVNVEKMKTITVEARLSENMDWKALSWDRFYSIETSNVSPTE
jgi:hypothetical protein